MRRKVRPKVALIALAQVLVHALLGSTSSASPLALLISCSALRAQIYDGIPGPSVLLGASVLNRKPAPSSRAA
jgi:hypothetical protein